MGGAAAVFEAVDILVNNAVVRRFAPIEAFPVERWNEALAFLCGPSGRDISGAALPVDSAWSAS
jgi:NAD(P)-dependent dehydrogenase (short-subunit alcohol dehydrogenase family)